MTYEHAAEARARMVGKTDFAERLQVALDSWVDCAADRSLIHGLAPRRCDGEGSRGRPAGGNRCRTGGSGKHWRAHC